MYIVIVFVIVVLFYLYLYKNIEGFESIQSIKYKNKLIEYPIKQDVYMNFLGDLNNSFKKNLDNVTINKNLPIKQVALCDNKVKIKVERKALNDAFEKIPSDSKEIFNSPIFGKLPSELEFTDNSKNKCLYKANHISEYTNPMFYLSENIYFPPKWIGPYKNTPLPKHTNLKQWSNMYNCCKGNI